MKILHLISGMVFVFYVSSGTVQPMFTRCPSILTEGGSRKSLTFMFENLSLKGTPQPLLFQKKLQQHKKIFSKDYSEFSPFYRPSYVQKRWFSGTNDHAFDGVNPETDFRMLKRSQLRALAEQLKCSEQEVQFRIEQQHEQLVRKLVEKDSDINARDSNGNTPLILAICLKNYAALKVLLEMNVDVNMPDLQGVTPLHYALFNDDIRYASALLEAGAKPNVSYGLINEILEGLVIIQERLVTPLRIAVEQNNIDFVSMLLTWGANPEFPTKQYKANLIARAQENGNKIIADLLEGYPLYGV